MGHDIIKKRDGSQNWHLDFTVNGLRFRDSLRTPNEKVARAMATQIHADALLGRFTNAKPEITLNDASVRYWNECIEGLPSAQGTRVRALALIAFFGKDKLLSDITEAELIQYAASRRHGQMRHPRSGKVWDITRAPNTINGDLLLANTLCRRARLVWKANAAELSIKNVLLQRPDDRQRFLKPDEEDRLFQVLRPDMHAMVRFALITGLRVGNVIGLTWEQVNWEERQIEFRVKSKKLGGKTHFLPITKTIAAILSAERGRHPEFVFTYVCGKTFIRPGVRRMKGQRYPYRPHHGGWKCSWMDALKAVGLRYGKFDRRNFRFHDLRHTAATRALKATRNLKVVQKLLGHEDIATTMRYAHVDTEDVREAMDEVEEMMVSHRRLKLVKKSSPK
jgi:integrase